MADAETKLFFLREDIENVTYYRPPRFRSDEEIRGAKLKSLLIRNVKPDPVSGINDVFILGGHTEVVIEGVSGHAEKLQEITDTEFNELLKTYVPEDRYQKYTERRIDDQGEVSRFSANSCCIVACGFNGIWRAKKLI